MIVKRFKNNIHNVSKYFIIIVKILFKHIEGSKLITKTNVENVENTFISSF